MRLHHLISPTSEHLLEAVTTNPFEAVISPLIQDASEPAKKWFLTNFRNWANKQPENLHKLTYLPPQANEKQKKAFEFDDLYEFRLSLRTQNLINHLLDYFAASPNPPRLERMSVPDVENAAKQWIERDITRAKKMKDDPKQIKTVMTFPNGYTIVQLLGDNALARESAQMGHCVGTAVGKVHQERVRSGQAAVYSLRDRSNVAHATIEIDSAGNSTQEIKGRQNRAPVSKYWPMLREFLEFIEAKIEGDYHHVGLLSIYDYDTGRDVVMTTDQFKDMVLDPNNQKGATYLAKGVRGSRGDEVIGLFSALYGSDRLTNELTEAAFKYFPDLATQVVLARGNQFNEEQQQIALTVLASEAHRPANSDLTLLRELVRVIKPAPSTVESLAAETSKPWVSALMLAYSQECPAEYRTMLEAPEMVERELGWGGARAAAVFFALAGTDRLTAEMVGPAFAYNPEQALKTVIKHDLKLDRDAVESAILKSANKGYSRESDAVVEALIERFRPDRDMAEELVKSGRATAIILTYLRKHVPESIDKRTAETALISMADRIETAKYFSEEKHPGAELQLLAARKMEGLVQSIQVIDPVLWPQLFEKLKPAPVSKSEEVSNRVPKKGRDGKPLKGARGEHLSHTYKAQREKPAKEYAAELLRAKRAAAENFLDALDPMLREPSQQKTDALEETNPKMRAAAKAFAERGKTPLFKLAVRSLNREANVYAVTGTGRDKINAKAFRDFAPTMDMRSVLEIVTGSYFGAEDRFGIFMAAAPSRVPEFLKAWYRRSDSARRHNTDPWGSFKFPIEKDLAFQALSEVWASDLPEGVKDRLGTAVLKRFKPSPDKLMDMLKKANSEEVTHKILKKTKKPSDELVTWVAATFPRLLAEDVPLGVISDAALADIFRSNWRVAEFLINVNLRDLGRDHMHRATFSKYDKENELYAKVVKAAKASGREKEFERFEHMAHLDDTFRDHGREEILANLPDYSIHTLLRLVERDSGLLIDCFKHLPAKRIAALVGAGGLEQPGWSRDPVNISLATIPRSKLLAVIQAIKEKKSSQAVNSLAKILLKDDRMHLDDNLLIELLDGGPDTAVKSSLIGRLVTDKGKDWVADHSPYEMALIKTPTKHMVEVLFDQFSRDKHSDYFFTKIVRSWFEASEYDWAKSTYAPNPVAARLIADEAKKRGGKQLIMAREMFQTLKRIREKAAAGEPLRPRRM